MEYYDNTGAKVNITISTSNETTGIGGWIKKLMLEFFDLVSFFIMAMGIVLCVRFFVFSPFTVVGQSMEPTFQDSDFVIIDKVSSQKPKLHERLQATGGVQGLKTLVSGNIDVLPEIHRGDVVVFVPPGKEVHYIKRVIGLPGETVKIEPNNKVVICKTGGVPSDCFTLDEPYLPSDYKTIPVCGVSEFEVTDGFFVMGDNREHSTDSRCCFTIGCFGTGKGYVVPYDYMIGKVRMRVLPHFTQY